uniref:Uncharacterized protein n=1 Tax=viral metagenome TaxID=1070528 RepID=A0A6C0BL02_9ZZZZ
MSQLLLNLDELHQRSDTTEVNRHKIFEEILKSCHTKIKKYNSEFKKQECLFEPPAFILGKPPYNYLSLVNYLLTSLRQNGLRAEWVRDRKAIYISWMKKDINMEQYRAQKTQVDPLDVGNLSQSFAILSVQPKSSDPVSNQKKTKKKKTAQPISHVAMLEYHPGVKDYVPINTHGL